MCIETLKGQYAVTCLTKDSFDKYVAVLRTKIYLWITNFICSLMITAGGHSQYKVFAIDKCIQTIHKAI